MTKTKIGLKLANGEFYPVLKDGAAARKRLVVTTVQDGQRSVQIDLYRGEGPTVGSAAYIGSLVIENIPFAPKGEPDIRLDLSLEADGTLSAYAEDAASGEHQSLQVSLESLSEEEKYEIPDFTFEEEATDSLPEAKVEAPAAEAPIGEAGAYSGGELASSFEEEESPAPRRGAAKIALFVLLALLVALGLAYLIYYFGLRGKGAPVAAKAPEPVAAAQPAAPAPAPPAPAQPAAATTPAAAAPATTPAQPQAPAPAAKATEPAPKGGGIWHRVRWGDTLWDLSYSYYQNPWLFGKIARANKIKNPDLIISGSRLWIPPR